MCPRGLGKEFASLTVEDLAAAPVWEPDYAATEEAGCFIVRPLACSVPLEPADRDRIVAAVFTLADGTQANGCIFQDERPSEVIAVLQPVIFTSGGHVWFWEGADNSEVLTIPERYQRLNGRGAAEVFPIRFEAAIPMQPKRISGTIPGFMYAESLKPGGVRVVR